MTSLRLARECQGSMVLAILIVGRKGEFSLAWDSGSNELNDFQRKKQKNKDVQVKLNYQEASHQEPIQRPSQASSNYQPVEAAKPYQISSPFALHTEAPKTNSSKSIPSCKKLS